MLVLLAGIASSAKNRNALRSSEPGVLSYGMFVEMG
jgi:hypothetical protein